MWLMTSPHVPRGTPVRALAAAPPFPALNVNAQRAEQTVSHSDRPRRNNAKKRQDKKRKTKRATAGSPGKQLSARHGRRGRREIPTLLQRARASCCAPRRDQNDYAYFQWGKV
ncbi:hypothetical protein NQZ68_028009 [Dissostichus eleginoides]|nr:hypothetical protein NQZ68_028009 [Dissostichus eleginoides]